MNGDNATAAPELTDDGLANTNWLLANGEGDHDAAQACRDRGPDWYLPAITELREIYANRGQLSEANLPVASWRWSSSEYNSSYARYQRYDGVENYYSKSTAARVRCVRR